MICKGCGNTDAYEKRSKWEDGVYYETCNQCQTFQNPSNSLDETERIYRKNFPAATAERLIGQHRVEKSMNQRRYSNSRGKAYE